MTERIVVGAALVDGGRLLAARRSAPAELAGRW
ncbi:DNA mismatch repair protein MutT, partial [Streptomyces sp. SID5914]|nr:DNA mismatch repair protein MutT [Streptomyces sp. SID5914]